MIDSSSPTASKSKIELDRVRKKSGRNSEPRRRRCAIRASWVASSSPCSSMSMTRMVGPSVSSPASRRPKPQKPCHRPRQAKPGWPAAEVGPQAADFINSVDELMNAAFERCLVRSKCRFKTLGVAF
jgi:hypothetical protein